MEESSLSYEYDMSAEYNKYEELLRIEEDLSQQLKDLEDLINDLERKTNDYTHESSSSSLISSSQNQYVIYSNGMKIDHKVKRIYQTFRNLKLFSNILNQNHGNYPLAPITLDGHKIYLNYKPTHFLSSRMLPNIVRETKYLNGDISYEYSNGSIIINTKKFKFIKYSNNDEEIIFTDNCKAYFYALERTLEYTDIDGTRILIFKSGREEVHFHKGKTYIFDVNGKIVVLDQDGDERLQKTFKIKW